MPDLPLWMWDVLADLTDHENQHGGEDHCLAATLERVPLDVRQAAEAIAAYRAKRAASDERASEATKTGGG